MQALPIGVQTFSTIRTQNLLYIDKTKHLITLIENGCRYFYARPRRFGKSLTLSTLESMFTGKTEFFRGLYCQEWIKQYRTKHPFVLRLDMSLLRRFTNADGLNASLVQLLKDFLFINDLDITTEPSCDGTLLTVILHLYKKFGPLVVLLDEYDKPILDHMTNSKEITEIRNLLHSWYTILKSCDQYILFLFITGISKFSKIGIFSAMNNLLDITHSKKYANITGYSQEELEYAFSDRIETSAQNLGISRDELLDELRLYYDGFSFDGENKVYNPFSILKFFENEDFSNYWYTSGSPSFLAQWLKKHNILDPEKYRHLLVKKDFTDSAEIEKTSPESFLFQAGYLTIEVENEKSKKNYYSLDYPNFEVLSSLSALYLENIYSVDNFISLGADIWQALEKGDLSLCVSLFNSALASVPYEDFQKRNEYWYRSLFLMLLRGAGILVFSEVHTVTGRSDIVIHHKERIIVLEFKFAADHTSVLSQSTAGKKQVKNYAQAYQACTAAVFVACDSERRLYCFPIEQ